MSLEDDITTAQNTDIFTLPQSGCEVVRPACLSVCLSARISQKRHVRTSRNSLYMLAVAVADDAIYRFVDDVMFAYNVLYGT